MYRPITSVSPRYPVVKSAGSRLTSSYDTFDHMSLPGQQTLRPPGPATSQEDQLEFIHRQLQSLEGRVLLNVLVVKDGGGNRLQGGTFFERSLLALLCAPSAMSELNLNTTHVCRVGLASVTHKPI